MQHKNSRVNNVCPRVMNRWCSELEFCQCSSPGQVWPFSPSVYMSTQGCLFFHQGIEDGCVLTLATSSIPDHAPAMQAYNNTLQRIVAVLSMTSSWNANFTPVVYILPIWSPGIKVINIGPCLFTSYVELETAWDTTMFRNLFYCSYECLLRNLWIF